MKTYNTHSNHEVSYEWSITAPETITEEEINALCECLADWTDEPSQASYNDMVASCHWEDHFYDGDEFDEVLKRDMKHAYLSVTIHVRACNRDSTVSSCTITQTAA